MNAPEAKLPRRERHARVSAKFQVRAFTRPQTHATRKWLERNLRRWRRVINHLPPFRPDNLDDPARYARANA